MSEEELREILSELEIALRESGYSIYHEEALEAALEILPQDEGRRVSYKDFSLRYIRALTSLFETRSSETIDKAIGILNENLSGKNKVSEVRIDFNEFSDVAERESMDMKELCRSTAILTGELNNLEIIIQENGSSSERENRDR